VTLNYESIYQNIGHIGLTRKAHINERIAFPI